MDFYDNLLSLMDRGSLMLILASRKNLDIYRNISSFFNLGLVCSLTGLTEGEASDLVRFPERNVHGNTAVLSETKQKLALQWGKRNPYLLQLSGCCLWEALTSDHDEPGQGSDLIQKLNALQNLHFIPTAGGLRYAGSAESCLSELENWRKQLAVALMILVTGFWVRHVLLLWV
jgi:hypothetical protein